MEQIKEILTENPSLLGLVFVLAGVVGLLGAIFNWKWLFKDVSGVTYWFIHKLLTMSMQMSNFVIYNMKSRMTGDCHVRFRENARVKFLCVTRLAAIW